ncbi:MBL fold metallo-hydrolase [Saccharopolyspora hattusasensis]|uniref:MBL fold metallo-hydrolase n=1 Tax=Saccharopolyspora hattusasensis TaxID=1128679 RepID=UPI003D9685D6
MDVIEIAPNLHMLRLESRQAYLWHEVRSATLIDTVIADSGSANTGLLTELGIDLERIVITHGHEDHVGSAAELRAATGAPVLAHGADAPVVRGERKKAEPVLLDWERPLLEGATLTFRLRRPARSTTNSATKTCWTSRAARG